MTSTIRSTMTVSQLKISWTVAAANASLNSSRSPIWAIDTIVLVTEVPIFAPITMGMACLKSPKKRKLLEESIDKWMHYSIPDVKYVASHHPDNDWGSGWRALQKNSHLETIWIYLSRAMPSKMKKKIDTKIPSIRPTIGFCMSSDWENTSPACFPANNLKKKIFSLSLI